MIAKIKEKKQNMKGLTMLNKKQKVARVKTESRDKLNKA